MEKEVEGLDYIQASLLTLEAYDIDYGICNHDPGGNPLSLVSMHKAEDSFSNGRFEMLAERYRVRKVFEHYGVSFFDLLQQPRYIVESILGLSRRAEESKNRKTQQQLTALLAEQEALKTQQK